MLSISQYRNLIIVLGSVVSEAFHDKWTETTLTVTLADHYIELNEAHNEEALRNEYDRGYANATSDYMENEKHYQGQINTLRNNLDELAERYFNQTREHWKQHCDDNSKNSLIPTIKEFRTVTNCSLKKAKDLIKTLDW